MAKYYYNGVLLPEIPAITAEYPYVWIRKNETSGYYDLVFAAYSFYHNGAIYCAGGENVIEPWYRVPIATAVSTWEWTFYKNTTGNFVLDTARTVLWSNHDIPEGSATSTTIYFSKSQLIPAISFKPYYQGASLIGEGTIKFWPYTVTRAVGQIWGVSGLGNSNPTLTRTFDNVGKTYSINSTAGTITTDFDTEFNFETVVQDGNTMIKIPTFYKRFDTITNNQITAFSISKTKVNDVFKPYPCFVKQDGSGAVMDYILLSKGKATGTKSKATCVSGESPLANVTRAEMRTATRANGTGWQQFDWMVLQLLRDLFCVVFATTDSQSIINGRVGDFSNTTSVGGTWDMPTLCGWNTTTKQNRFFGIEDIFGNLFDWCDGVTFSGSTIYSTTSPDLFSDSTGGLMNNGSRADASSWVTSLEYNPSQPFLNYPYRINLTGSAVTYYCDYEFYNSEATGLFVGGSWNVKDKAGLWYWGSNAVIDTSGDGFGGRLVYRPI